MRQKVEKLRDLLGDVPHGYLVDTAMLAKYDIDYRLAHKYVKRHWLEQVARGLYRRPFGGADGETANTDWRIAVLSMMLMDYEVHVGGMTALTLHGHAHYLSLGHGQDIYLYGNDIPTWLKRVPTNDVFITRSMKLFNLEKVGVANVESDFAGSSKTALTPLSITMRASDAERAILEALDELPNNASFHHIDMVFQSLTGLRPNRLQSLLTDCASIKTKRLFFVFADRHAHAWRKYIDPENFDLGSGARELVKGGKYHPRYHISLPAEYIDTAGERDTDGP